MLRLDPKIYKWIMVGCFFLLCILIGFLTFKTYQYKDRNYQNYQKSVIEQAYGRYVVDEKLFPGGNVIFANVFKPHLTALLSSYRQDSADFDRKKTTIVAGLLSALRQQQHMDTLMQAIYAGNQLDADLQYNLLMDKIAIYDVESATWIPIFSEGRNDLRGLIAGDLKEGNENNRVLSLSVSSGLKPAYRFTYLLHVDYPDRTLRLLLAMSPVLLFAVLSVLLIVFINYITFRSLLLQRKEAALKTDFLNHISHEFNTPITTLLVCANTLEEQRAALGPEDIGALAKVMERQANRLKLYCRQVLDAVSMPEQAPVLERMDMPALTNQLLSDLKLRYAAQIEIAYMPFNGQIVLPVDPALYFSILDNLIANACKFKSELPPRIEFLWQKHADVWRLAVSDNGLGIAWDDRTAIFDKFYRAKHVGNLPGLGLGLYYVQSCVLRMGWNIYLAKKTSAGALFFLEMSAIDGKSTV